jgi:hypothetical protein
MCDREMDGVCDQERECFWREEMDDREGVFLESRDE